MEILEARKYHDRLKEGQIVYLTEEVSADCPGGRRQLTSKATVLALNGITTRFPHLSIWEDPTREPSPRETRSTPDPCRIFTPEEVGEIMSLVPEFAGHDMDNLLGFEAINSGLALELEAIALQRRGIDLATAEA